MPPLLKKLLTSPATYQTGVFYISSFVSNILSYIFHLVLLRMISPSEYGEFSSYLSLLYLLSIPSGAISIMVTQHASKLYASGQDDQANGFFHHIFKNTLRTSIIAAIGIALATPILSHNLLIEKKSLYVLAASISFTMLQAIINAYLTSLQKFLKLTTISILSNSSKIIIAYVLILEGLKVMGAVIGIFASMLIGIAIALSAIKDKIFPPKNLLTPIPLKSLTSFSILYATGSLSLISTDILLVRYFFTTQESGIYAAIMILAKTIYFGISPLNILIIPQISKKTAQNKNPLPTIVGFITIALILGSIGISIFTMFPEKIITILAGSQYINASSLLLPALITMLLYAINIMLINYHIAHDRQTINIWLIIAALLQPIAIIMFHKNLMQIIIINSAIQILLCIGNITFSFFSKKPLNYKPNIHSPNFS